MKRIFKIATILSVAVAISSVSSCVKDVSCITIESSVKSSAISFTEEISGMSTRATDIAFESGDKISVTAYSADGGVYAANVEYTHSGSLFTSAEPITYGGDGVEELSFRAIYPYVEMSESKVVDFTIQTNQSAESNYTLSDLMSSYVDVTSDLNPKLSFKHILTKVVFNVTAEDIDMASAVATIYTPTEVEYNIAQLSSTTTNDAVAVTMARNGDSSYKAIVSPQTYAAGSTLGVLTAGGVEYEIVLKNQLVVSAGVQYNYSLIIADGELTFEEPTVVDWADGGEIEEEEEDTYETSQIYISSTSELGKLDLDNLAEGEVIVWKDGTYSGVAMTITATGTADRPVRLRAETPGGVIFENSRIDIRGSHIELSGFWIQTPSTTGSFAIRFYTGSSYCKVSNCAITDDSEESTKDVKWVSMYGTNNTLDGCSITGQKNKGCTVVVWVEEDSDGNPIAPVSHNITNNYFERPHTVYEDGAAVNGQEIIRIGESDYSMSIGDCLVEGNHFYQCHGELAECISSKLCNNIFRGNLLEESQSALVLRHGNGCVIEGNYLIGGGLENTGGIRIIAEDHVVRNNFLHNISGEKDRAGITIARGIINPYLSGYYQVKNVEISGNTLVNCAYSFNVNYGMAETHVLVAEDTTISDNTVYCSSSEQYHVYVHDDYPDTGITWSDNQFIGTTGLFYNVSSFLAVAGSEPYYPTAAIQAVRDGAGCSWSLN